mmetsp:Transcript_29054/g.61839  ORF Transcript_29054/g.61839 Transcript_29054/m.61839 type:complete len:103 (+) Transcript_29054:2455-2763(+)
MKLRRLPLKRSHRRLAKVDLDLHAVNKALQDSISNLETMAAARIGGQRSSDIDAFSVGLRRLFKNKSVKTKKKRMLSVDSGKSEGEDALWKNVHLSANEHEL